MRVAANSSSKIVLQYLRYVLAAAEKHSFRQAAVELGVWESTISRGIRDLEHEMGVALFIRHPGGVTLINAGTRFLNHALLAVGRIEYALKDAGAAGRGEVGTVRIGIFTSLASGFLADLLEAYQAKNPLVHLDFVEGSPAEHVSAVQHHRMDIAFLTGEARQPGGKVVQAWAIEGNWDPALIRSNTFEMEWPPRPGRRQTFPEIDRAAWFVIADARRRILKGNGFRRSIG
jgi:DNA-binding transcriptional LysR family regulator